MGIPSFYFKRKRGRANAFVLCGSNVGGFAGPPLVAYLVSEYGFRGATLITAAITLHVCISATVFHPVEWHTPRRDNDKARAPIKPKNKQTMISSLLCYWQLLKSARTHVIIFTGAAIVNILKTVVSLLPLVLETNGHTLEDATFITSIIGICGFLTRLVIPSLADTSWFNVRMGYIACISVGIVTLIGNVQVHSIYNSTTFIFPSLLKFPAGFISITVTMQGSHGSFLPRIPRSLHINNQI